MSSSVAHWSRSCSEETTADIRHKIHKTCSANTAKPVECTGKFITIISAAVEVTCSSDSQEVMEAAYIMFSGL